MNKSEIFTIPHKRYELYSSVSKEQLTLKCFAIHEKQTWFE